MRVFVAGASGAMGSRLVPKLIAAGHEVIGTHRAPTTGQLLVSLGARPMRVDLLDPAAVHEAVHHAKPDAIVHQATALANVKFGRSLDKSFVMTNRLRTEGTDALIDAARNAGVRRFVAQSVAFYRYAREGGPIKTENDPLDTAPPRVGTQVRGASNAKAKRELGWTPRYASWRTGFPATYAAAEIIEAVPGNDAVNRGAAGGTR